jgi:hypothetical protein
VDRVAYAQLLHDASEVGLGLDKWHARQVAARGDTLTLKLPQRAPAAEIPVVELFVKG